MSATAIDDVPEQQALGFAPGEADLETAPPIVVVRNRSHCDPGAAAAGTVALNRTYLGDCREWLPRWAAAGLRAHTCVTSPPYFGLRDYGTARWEGGDPNCQHVGAVVRTVPAGSLKQASNHGAVDVRSGDCSCGARRIDPQIGLESTPQAYVDEIVTVCGMVRDVLCDEGTLWLNLGSSYVSGDMSASPSRPPQRVPACDSNGIALPDLKAFDWSYRDLCDGCLNDFLNHHSRSADNSQSSAQCAPPLSPTSRGNGRQDCVAGLRAASPSAVRASTNLQSWLQHRGACSHCANRVSGLSSVRSLVGDAQEFSDRTWLDYAIKFKQKDLLPIPWMVALALQADGWYLRSDIIWAKPSPMPESVSDRPTKAHEYLFLLAKSERYYYDAISIAEASVRIGPTRNFNSPKTTGRAYAAGRNPSGNEKPGAVWVQDGLRNRRSVWWVASEGYDGAHFAVFPTALIEPCIVAGAPPGGIVLDPFMGSGTTAQVATDLGRQFIGCEINPEYVAIQNARQMTVGMAF